jgi:hypothetical protein
MMDGQILGNQMAASVGATDANVIASYISMANTIVLHIQSLAEIPLVSTIISAAPGSPVTGLLPPGSIK